MWPQLVTFAYLVFSRCYKSRHYFVSAKFAQEFALVCQLLRQMIIATKNIELLNQNQSQT